MYGLLRLFSLSSLIVYSLQPSAIKNNISLNHLMMNPISYHTLPTELLSYKLIRKHQTTHPTLYLPNIIIRRIYFDRCCFIMTIKHIMR